MLSLLSCVQNSSRNGSWASVISKSVLYTHVGEEFDHTKVISSSIEVGG